MRSKTTHTFVTTLAIVGLLLAGACSSDDSDHGDADQGVDRGADQTAADAGTDTLDDEDAAPDGEVPVDPDAGGPDGTQPSEIDNAFGFAMRAPVEHTIPCPDAPDYMEDELTQVDMDWICTFDHGGVTGQVYIASTPVSCEAVGMSMAPGFEAQAAFISVDGSLTALSDALYDWGGNHHNDSLGFAHAGKYYRFYHSSFGWGWRQCQPMDCIQVMASQDGALIEDGCTAERTIPAVCLQVEAGNSYEADDFVDTFAKCPGDDS